MGTEQRKEREKTHRRNRIIDAAETVIFANGLKQSTMTDIAREAELSKGTLYLYFKNKNDLHMAICERGSNMLNERFRKVFSGDHTGLELIRLMGETYLEFVRTNPDYFNTFMNYEAQQNPEELESSESAQTCQQNVQEAVNLMIRALQIGMQDGTVDDSYDPKELAIMIWASTRGITTMHHMKNGGHHFQMLKKMDINSKSLFDSYLNLLGKGMAAEEKKKKHD